MATKFLDQKRPIIAVHRYLPGEREAINTVLTLGDRYGFGNLISVLKNGWSEKLQRENGFSPEQADRGATHICPWCQVDGRTGKKAKKAARVRHGKEL